MNELPSQKRVRSEFIMNVSNESSLAAYVQRITYSLPCLLVSVSFFSGRKVTKLKERGISVFEWLILLEVYPGI